MDSISQIALGAACGEAVLGKKAGNRALLWGAVAGTIPDLDVVLNPFFHPVDALFVHRGVSHSLLFAALLAPLLAWIIYRIYKRRGASYLDWLKLSFWSTATHPMLDAFTGYGTPLFWPFSEYRVDINCIFIVDPLYTLPFLLCLILVMRAGRNSERRQKFNRLGLALSTGYLAFTFIHQQWMHHKFREGLEAQGLHAGRSMVFPTPLNSVLYGFLAESDSGYHIAYRSAFDGEGIRYAWFPSNRHLIDKWKEDEHIKKLIRFSKGYYAIREENGSLYFSDMRFGQAGGWADPQAPFVFSFKLVPLPNGSVSVEKGDWRSARMSAMGTLWDRILGR